MQIQLVEAVGNQLGDAHEHLPRPGANRFASGQPVEDLLGVPLGPGSLAGRVAQLVDPPGVVVAPCRRRNPAALWLTSVLTHLH